MTIKYLNISLIVIDNLVILFILSHNTIDIIKKENI